MRDAPAGTIGDGVPTPAAYSDELLAAARRSIEHGLARGTPPPLEITAHPPALQRERASFVTLLDGGGRLRGCIGSIEARRPLIADVSENAFSAAFEDPRFPALTPAEYRAIEIKLALLTPPEPIAFHDEDDLVAGLRPGEDGVMLIAGEHRGTLLPAVWEQIPDAREFWQTVKRKAGLARGDWPADMQVYRYRTETIA